MGRECAGKGSYYFLDVIFVFGIDSFSWVDPFVSIILHLEQKSNKNGKFTVLG